MNARQFAKQVGVEVVGKLKRVDNPVQHGKARMYMDDYGTLYFTEKGNCTLIVEPEYWETGEGMHE